jgi:hypothetical protein
MLPYIGCHPMVLVTPVNAAAKGLLRGKAKGMTEFVEVLMVGETLYKPGLRRRAVYSD